VQYIYFVKYGRKQLIRAALQTVTKELHVTPFNSMYLSQSV